MLGLLLFCLGGVFDAAQDKISYHYSSSIFSALNKQFWDPIHSWLNKYKASNVREERFWGSSRWFVMFTDAWHLMKFLKLSCYALAALLWVPFIMLPNAWVAIALELVIMRIAERTIFTLFYSLLFNTSTYEKFKQTFRNRILW